MLFYSAATLIASVAIGNEGMSVGEWWELLRHNFARVIPDHVADVQGLDEIVPASLGGSLPMSLDEAAERIVVVLTSLGWSIGALWAAVWKRLQMVALFLLAAVSGGSAHEALMATTEMLESSDTAAMLLQGFSALCASLGLMGLAKAKLFGRKKVQNVVQQRFYDA